MINKNSIIILLIIIILLGAGARLWGLADHFGHVDDLGVAKKILDYQKEGKPTLFATSHEWTYAPFQFLFTSQLINLKQSYRDVLFWGRLPSCLFGILAIFALIGFYRTYERPLSFKVVMAAALVAFSWENIIFAKQMHNYAIGVMACILLVWLYVYLVKVNLRHPEQSEGSNVRFFGLRPQNDNLLRMLLAAVILAVLTSMQYSMLFFAPAFFGGLFFSEMSNRRAWLVTIRNVAVSAAGYIALILPMWILFVSRHVDATSRHMSNWNRGIHEEFFFQLPAGLFAQIKYTISFFIKNAFLVFENNLAFVPWSSFLSPILTWMFFILLILGIVNYVVSTNRLTKFLGLFGLLTVFTWMLLVITDKITLSPTRHNLILLPLLAITVAEGFGFAIETFYKNCEVCRRYAQTLFISVLIILFAVHYPIFLKNRQDRFHEKDVLKILKDYKIDALVIAQFTLQVELMKGVRDLYNYYDINLLSHKFVINKKVADPYGRIAWISHRQKLTPEVFEAIRNAFNMKFAQQNAAAQARGLPPVKPLMRAGAGGYRIIYQEEIDSPVEIENGHWTEDGSNNYYLYVLERK